jgi:hypothetical protein
MRLNRQIVHLDNEKNAIIYTFVSRFIVRFSNVGENSNQAQFLRNKGQNW